MRTRIMPLAMVLDMMEPVQQLPPLATPHAGVELPTVDPPRHAAGAAGDRVRLARLRPLRPAQMKVLLP